MKKKFLITFFIVSIILLSIFNYYRHDNIVYNIQEEHTFYKKISRKISKIYFYIKFNVKDFKHTPANLKLSDLNLTNDIDVSKIIAHAGGTIDGFKYTESLEALNHSYNNGFRIGYRDDK